MAVNLIYLYKRGYMINFKQAFGKNLKQIRKSKNITQETLAEMIGIHPRQVSKIETGEHFPNSTTLENICISFSVSPRELFNFDLQEIVSNTGSGDKYTYKAIVEGNVVYLDNNSFRKQKIEKINSTADIDIKMVNMAKKTMKTITVQYYNGKDNYRIIEYYPNGEYKIIKDDKNIELEKLLLRIQNMVKNDNKMLDYFSLASNAINNNQDLEKLELILSGIKMGRK